jgi:MoaA/NifB/PqqE/SkfB family radical SAM enzyme
MEISAAGMSAAKRLNLAAAGTNLLHRRLHPWSMPLHMQFELTNYCNLRCPVCPTGTRELQRRAEAMPPEIFERVFDEVGPFLLTASLWGWGESLLHPRLAEILSIARKHPVATLLSTNGMPLERDHVIEALVQHPPSCLIVAIDGLTDETNSRFRAGAKLATILAGVRRLAELKRQRNARYPVLHMRYIVMKHNEHEVAALESFARDHAFDLLSIRTLSVFDTASAESVHEPFNPQSKLWQAYRYEGGRRVAREEFICQQPFWFPSLLADGTVVACEQDHAGQLALGTVAGGRSFRDVWYGDEARRVRQRIRDCWQDISFCRNCPYAGRRTSDVSVAAVKLAEHAPVAETA